MQDKKQESFQEKNTHCAISKTYLINFTNNLVMMLKTS